MAHTKKVMILYLLLFALFLCCGVTNVFAARYYRLLENERKIYLGLRGIDSLAAYEYLMLDSPGERSQFYENFWLDKDEEKHTFEKRIEYAFRQYAKYAPLSDDRVWVHVKYGPPLRREEITPQKKIAIKTTEAVKPAEIWTYKKDGFIFDFVRYKRAYELISKTQFGENVVIPHLIETQTDTLVQIDSPDRFEFNVTVGRFRQKKNLTRLELYMSIEFEDTTGVIISRRVVIYDNHDNVVETKEHVLVPQGSEQGTFYDEVNVWLEPAEYRVVVEMADLKKGTTGIFETHVNLVEYQDDAKEISDLVSAALIDHAFTHGKFEKPVGRVIPLTQSVLPVKKPFYFYAEVYNLETKGGMHHLKTTYEVYNKEKMRREIVDVMIKDIIEAGSTAYLASEYHPMDLNPGHYMIVLRVKDLLSEKERTAVCEFQLVQPE